MSIKKPILQMFLINKLEYSIVYQETRVRLVSCINAVESKIYDVLSEDMLLILNNY